MFTAFKKIFSEYFFFSIAILLGSFFVVAILSPYFAQADFTDNSNDAAGFGGGTHVNTQWNAGSSWVEMDATGLSSGFATFTSRIVDTGGSTIWSSVSWVPEFPAGKELPNNAGVESAYTVGNMDMTNNNVLLHFNESTGATSFTDSSGSSNSGSCSGGTCPAVTTDGRFNNAFTFDGSDDEVDLPSQAVSTLIGSQFTIAFWVNPGGSADRPTFGFTGAGATNNASPIGSYNGGLNFGDGVGNQLMTALPDASANQWTHYAIVDDGSNYRVYVNGSQVDSAAITINPASGSDRIFVIGKSGFGGGYDHPFAGSFDEFAIFSRGLSATEVSNMYKRGALRLKFQVQSCDDASCSGETFVGPSGSDSFYTEMTTSSLGFPSKTLMNISNNRYFQYRSIFETSSSTLSVHLSSVTLAGGIPSVTLTESGGTTITEAGGQDTYTLVLGSAPSSNVTIAISPDINSTVSTSSIVFTTSNWNTAVTVTSTAVDDSIAQGTHYSTITHSASSADSNYNGISISSVVATITDNDTAGVTVTQSGGTTVVTEAGVTDTYTVVLTSAPTSTVTVALSISDSSQLSLSTSSIAFTSSNWSEAITVTSTATNDSIAEGTQTVSVSYSVTSNNWNYNGISVSATSVSITDNDTAGITVTESGGSTSVTEGGATDSFTLVLTSAPTSTVTVALTPNAQTTLSTSSVQFTSSNWDTAVTVTVTAVDDSSVEGAHSGTIDFAVTSSNWNYSGFSVASISISITDNDTASGGGGNNGTGNSQPVTPPAPELPAAQFGPAPLGAANVVVSPGKPAPFAVGGESHTVTQLGVATNNEVTILLQSEPITLTLFRDTVRDVDTNADGKFDLRLLYTGLQNGVSRINISALINVGESNRPVSINQGAYATNISKVILKLKSSGAALVAVSEDKKFTGASYVPYTSILTWNLSPGVGEKTVYVRFRSELGGSIDAFDTIYYEPVAPRQIVGPVLSPQILNIPNGTVSRRFLFTKFLSEGSVGIEVRELQKVLIQVGLFPAGKMTGFYGPLTKNTVKVFQKNNNLDAKGYVGPGTRSALNKINQ